MVVMSSIGSVSLDENNYSVPESNVDRFALSNLLFTSWVRMKIETSDYLNPPKYSLRHIEDMGSIFESLKSSHIKLFEHCPISNGDPIFLRIIRDFLNPFILSTVGFPLSILYHTSLTIKHIVQFQLSDKENAQHVWKKVHRSAIRALDDLRIFLLFGLMISLCFFGTLLDINNRHPSQDNSKHMKYFIGLGVCSFLSLLALIPYPSTFSSKSTINSYGCELSLMLRKEFGIVAKNGMILSWNGEKDQEDKVEYLDAYSLPIDRYNKPWGYFNNPWSFRVNGPLTDLYSRP